MVSSSSNCSRTCSPRWTLRRFLCSMTLARNSLRCRAYASSDSRLCRVIMPLFYESGLDLREGEGHLAARRHRHAQLTGNLRDREGAAHHRALHHQRMLAAGAAQRLQHVADSRALDLQELDHLDALGRRHDVGHGELVAPHAPPGGGEHRALAERSFAVSTPSTISCSSTTSSNRTPRVIMN